jgi:uncharacterized protein YjbI with pentapeptide repeats
MRRLHTWWQQLDPLVRLRAGIVTALLVVGLAVTMIGVALNGDWPGLWLNLGSGLFGTGLTFLLIDQLLGQRERQADEERATASSKADLIARLGSNVRSFAVAAAEELRRHGWLIDGSLHGVSLMTADLQGAPLSHAQLTRVNLSDANLQQADLGRAVLTEASLDGANLHDAYLLAIDLQRASLIRATLSGADLREANLQQAELVMADLRQARLTRADLRGTVLSTADLREANLQQADLRHAYGREADLRGADLQGALLQDARFDAAQLDEQTILPDGTHWTLGRRLEEFTGTGDLAARNGHDAPAAPDLLETLLQEHGHPFD